MVHSKMMVCGAATKPVMYLCRSLSGSLSIPAHLLSNYACVMIHSDLRMLIGYNAQGLDVMPSPQDLLPQVTWRQHASVVPH